jgi:hypothetical protein
MASSLDITVAYWALPRAFERAFDSKHGRQNYAQTTVRGG